MKMLLVMISAIAAAAGFSSAAPCGNGGLASYIALESGGCTIGTNTLFGFQTVSGIAGATPIATSALAITPFGGNTSFGFTAGTATTNEKTNRNLALVLADHSRDLPFALQLMQTELPTRGEVNTWDALSWVLFKNGRLDEARTASAKATRLGTPEPMFYRHTKEIAQTTHK